MILFTMSNNCRQGNTTSAATRATMQREQASEPKLPFTKYMSRLKHHQFEQITTDNMFFDIFLPNSRYGNQN